MSGGERDRPAASATTLSAMIIRRATSRDAERICEIYNAEVIGSTVTLDLVPRTVEQQREWIDARSGGLAAVVAEVDGTVVGFGSLSFYRDRPGYRTSVEDSVYVDHDHHGTGVGSRLLGELVDIATKHGFHTIFAKIIGPQAASVALHERHGFSVVGIEREVGRKFGKWHDVAVMQLLLQEVGRVGFEPT